LDEALEQRLLVVRERQPQRAEDKAALLLRSLIESGWDCAAVHDTLGFIGHVPGEVIEALEHFEAKIVRNAIDTDTLINLSATRNELRPNFA
jgi:hypothetical protein